MFSSNLTSSCRYAMLFTSVEIILRKLHNAKANKLRCVGEWDKRAERWLWVLCNRTSNLTWKDTRSTYKRIWFMGVDYCFHFLVWCSITYIKSLTHGKVINIIFHRITLHNLHGIQMSMCGRNCKYGFRLL